MRAQVTMDLDQRAFYKRIHDHCDRCHIPNRRPGALNFELPGSGRDQFGAEPERVHDNPPNEDNRHVCRYA